MSIVKIQAIYETPNRVEHNLYKQNLAINQICTRNRPEAQEYNQHSQTLRVIIILDYASGSRHTLRSTGIAVAATLVPFGYDTNGV
jgi:hypothetical protein